MRKTTITLLLMLFSLGCDPRYGVLESMFVLSEDSRLPQWITVPVAYSRRDIKVTVDWYSHPLSPLVRNKAVIIVYGPPPEKKKLIEKVGTIRWHPFTEQQYKGKKSYFVFPNFTIIEVDGIEEVFEQRSKGDILYISDDPKLTANLRREVKK